MANHGTGTAMQLTPLRVPRPTQTSTTALQPLPVSAAPVAASPLATVVAVPPVCVPPPATALPQHPLSGVLRVINDELRVCKDEVQKIVRY